MIPAGAAAFKGKIDEEIAVTPTAPGLYGYKCKPHASMGMVGRIQVGGSANKAELKLAAAKLAPLARKAMSAALAEVK